MLEESQFKSCDTLGWRASTDLEKNTTLCLATDAFIDRTMINNNGSEKKVLVHCIGTIIEVVLNNEPREIGNLKLAFQQRL